MTSKRPVSARKYTTLLAHLGAIAVMLAWGTSFLSTKVLMVNGGFTPVEMFVYRFAGAYLILLALTWKRIRSNSWRDELTMLLCGVCSGSLYYILENYALQLTTTANVSMLASISPLFTTLLMVVFYHMKLKMGVLFGSITAFIGVVCIIFSHGESIEFRPAGDLLALSASLGWAVYTIAIKRITPHYSSLFITRKMFFYGVLTACPLLFLQNEPYHLQLLFDMSQPQYLLNMGFLVLICSCAGFFLWNEVMKALGPVSSNNYLYVQPLVTMVAGYFLLGEQIFPLGYLGCVLIIGGLIMADKIKK